MHRFYPTRLAFSWLLIAGVSAVSAEQTFRFNVFGLFHPIELIVHPVAGEVLSLRAGEQTIILEGPQPARLTFQEDAVRCETADGIVRAARVYITGRGGPTKFHLEVPGKIARLFRGHLDVSAASNSLMAVVSMDPETATASIVAAESPPGALLEALRAQAVATRSYLRAAGNRHDRFDFCDTTHCQYLREPPPPGNPAWQATVSTRYLVITYDGAALEALYSRSCGGRTHSLKEVGLAARGYPYYSVTCRTCARSPEAWESSLPLADAHALLTQTGFESARLGITRVLGWSAVPSNRYRVRREGEMVQLRGQGTGHGVGLCQRGAQSMAAGGSSFLEILQHYFPGTTVSGRPVRP